jgi:hypothetical protein
VHPRNHLAEHYPERGDRTRGLEIYEETAGELRKADAPGHILGGAIYHVSLKPFPCVTIYGWALLRIPTWRR